MGVSRIWTMQEYSDDTVKSVKLCGYIDLLYQAMTAMQPCGSFDLLYQAMAAMQPCPILLRRWLRFLRSIIADIISSAKV